MRENQSYRIKNNIGERKIMKTKSLFISTIAMVVMLIVALSVGTFAWYTAQDNVQATNGRVTALSSSDSAIAVGWDTSSTASTLGLDQTQKVRPMIPTAKPATGATEPTFNEALLKVNNMGQEVIASYTDPVTPWTQKGTGGDAAKTTLYVINLDQNVGCVVTPKVAITASESHELDTMLRVSLYTYAAATGYTYLGTWGSGNAYACKISTAGADGASLVDELSSTIIVAGNKFDLLGTGADGSTFSLVAGAHTEIRVYAWLEGTLLTTANNKATDESAFGEFNITFTSAQPSN
jgi:hypothetical protein